MERTSSVRIVGDAYGVVIPEYECNDEPSGSAEYHTEPEGSMLHADQTRPHLLLLTFYFPHPSLILKIL